MATSKDDSKVKTWTESLEKQFLLEIISRGEVPINGAMLDDIAKKWGKPHTKGSLSKKFQRMKQAIAKENEGSGVETGDNKRKACDDGENDEVEAEGTPKKKSKTNGWKAVNVKAENGGEA